MSADDLARYVGEVRLEGGGLVEVGRSDGGLTLDYGQGGFRPRPPATLAPRHLRGSPPADVTSQQW